jgi:hypothetical protein
MIEMPRLETNEIVASTASAGLPLSRSRRITSAYASDRMGDPIGGLLLLGSALCAIGASLVVCYVIWLNTWEGWESWNARTGLDAERADEERLLRLTRRK